ncbi:uncharacterized protein LOC142560600 [Dermacentor variabilis]|uniref:uncharacterized protein LOC142560600 n=1 Tax=Dermacentor variabilis TaxID=34621 RepID=UPI003F5B7291
MDIKVRWRGLLVALRYGQLDCHCGVRERTLRKGGGCRIEGGYTLENREELSAEQPCERYKCLDGELTTERCRLASERMCRQVFPGVGAYPRCCGRAVICT